MLFIAQGKTILQEKTASGKRKGQWKTMLHKSVISVNLNKEQVLQYYKGVSTRVQCYDKNGQRMDLPIDIFLKYVTHEGIFGTFEITYDERGKFKCLQRIS
jgi:hypothetical protein